MGTRREDEFKRFLNWLLELMQERSVEALLLSGDIFDHATPSDGTLEIFHDFLSRADSTGCRHIIMTAGNHDGVAQLKASVPLLERYHAHLICSLTQESAKDCLIPLNDAAGIPQALVCAVPYLRVREVSEVVRAEESDSSYTRGIASVYARVAEAAEQWKISHPNLPIIAMGHLSVRGASPTASTHHLIGTLDVVNPHIFPPVFDYVALGHIHKSYPLDGGRLQYCGSPLPMGEDEAGYEHRVILLNTEDMKVESVVVPVFTAYEHVSCATVEELEALPERWKEKQGTPVVLRLEYAGMDISSDALRVRVAELLANTCVIHYKLVLKRFRSVIEVDEDCHEELSDYSPENLFERRLQNPPETLPADKIPLLRQMFRSVLSELNL